MINYKERFGKIGEELASLYGGSLYDIKGKEESIIFFIREHGDCFFCELTFDEIKEKYSHLLPY